MLNDVPRETLTVFTQVQNWQLGHKKYASMFSAFKP